MRPDAVTLATALLASALMCGCGGGNATFGSGGNPPPAPTISASTDAQTGVQNGAVIVTLTASAGATIYYTVDGTTPTASSQQYLAPFLVASSLTVKAIAVLAGTSSTVTSQSFSPNIPSNTLVWSDEFTSTGAQSQPNPAIWTYDTGNGGFGNGELENYCAWGSNTSPCSAANPSEFVGATDGYLHIVAQQPSSGVYTSARLKTQGLFSFQYGRLEFRAAVPEAQGFWPAAWLLGNNIAIPAVSWPACGEQDVLERINAALNPDWNEGSVHGTGFTSAGLGTKYFFSGGATAAQWHTYGMAWAKGTVTYYVDEVPYVTFTTADATGIGGVWPFDAGQSNFILLNLAIGGDWPGAPDGTTPFPSEMLVDYVRIYSN